MINKNSSSAHISKNIILECIPGFNPLSAVILGSGLGDVSDILDVYKVIKFSELPGFPLSSVEGHANELILGSIRGISIIFMKGRGHFYENGNIAVMNDAVRTFKLLGCRFLIITSASGSINKDIHPGDIVIIKDHINFMPLSPMVGPNDEEFGNRFFSMANAYDKNLREKMKNSSKNIGVILHEGVFSSCTGPNFETPSEVNMMRILGSDIVGMSIVPEVITARHCNLKILAISVVTNYAEGLSKIELSHSQTLKYADIAKNRVKKILQRFFFELDSKQNF